MVIKYICDKIWKFNPNTLYTRTPTTGLYKNKKIIKSFKIKFASLKISCTFVLLSVDSAGNKIFLNNLIKQDYEHI